LAILALFDFDGTITDKDSLFKFIRFYIGDIKFIVGLVILFPMLIKFKLGLITNSKAKEYLMAYYFKGTDLKTFKKLATEYSLFHINEILRPKAMERIDWHQALGHEIVIISASIRCWLKPWCDRHNISLISTELEVIDSKITGKFSTKNCHGIEKERRIKEVYDLRNYEYIYAYGDSIGDKEMLALANESFYKPFR